MLKKFQRANPHSRVPIRSKPFANSNLVSWVQDCDQRSQLGGHLVIVNKWIFFRARGDDKIKRLRSAIWRWDSISITRSVDFSIRSSKPMLFSYKSRIQWSRCPGDRQPIRTVNFVSNNSWLIRDISPGAKSQKLNWSQELSLLQFWRCGTNRRSWSGTREVKASAWG